MNIDIKQKIVTLIYETLSYAYCDNCGREEEDCDDCHRKYQSWRVSEGTCSEIVDKIEQILET